MVNNETVNISLAHEDGNIMARPRSFDPEQTLGALKALFWEKGYNGTSMQDVEAATGLGKQSLYRVWTDKRAMYLAALSAYARDEMTGMAQLLDGEGSPRARLATLLDGAVAQADRRGCFLCNASLDQAQADPETRKVVQGMMQMSLAAFTRLAGGDAAKGAALNAGYNGLRGMSAAGLDRTILRKTADGVLSVLED